MAETAVNRPAGGWFKRSEITDSQVAVLNGVAIRTLPLVRWSVDYSQLTNPPNLHSARPASTAVLGRVSR